MPNQRNGPASGLTDGVSLIDAFSAARALAGEPVRIVPLMARGYVRGGVVNPPIDEHRLSEIETNFKNRATSGFYQTLVPINKEHRGIYGKIGTIGNDLHARADGVYSTLDLTPEGRKSLEAGEFSYLSPEIRWETVDIESGENLGASLAGLAVTNYPYFGDRTALFSEEAERLFADVAEDADDEEYLRSALLESTGALLDLVRALNWRITDLEVLRRRWDLNLEPGSLIDARRAVIGVLAKVVGALPTVFSMRYEVLSGLVATKLERDQHYYPRSAYAITESDDPAQWRLPLMAYLPGTGDGEIRLNYSKHLVERAIRQAGNELSDDNAPGWARILEACSVLGLDPDDILRRETMSGNNDNGAVVSIEQFEALQAEMEKMRGDMQGQIDKAIEEERDSYRAQIEERDQTIAAQGSEIQSLNQQRLTDRFTAEAESFAALGVKSDDLAAELIWLYQVDDTEDQAHFNFFRGLLSKADEGLARSESFREKGGTPPPRPSDAMGEIERRVTAKAKEMGVTAEPGTEQYSQVMEQVLKEDPELYARYRQELTRA